MPSLKTLRGLNASDRSQEEKQAINEVMGYNEELPDTNYIFTEDNLQINNEPVDTVRTDTSSSRAIKNAIKAKTLMDEEFQNALDERRSYYGVDRNSINENANSYIDKVAREVSSYYKKYNGTNKLSLDDQQKKELAAEYDARKELYGEQQADVWLDNHFKDIVGNNQSWWEQAVNSVTHLIPAIEGGAIQTYGMLHGALNHIIGTDGYDKNDDLNEWDSFWNDVIDNPVTRYGRDMEHAGATHVQDALKLIGLGSETAEERIANTKKTATKYNPEGIGADAIVTTEEQDNKYLSSATPWQALQSGGFTALSMLTGAAEAKSAQMLFNGLAKGANWLNKTGRALRTERALERTLTGLKKAQTLTDIAIIPGSVGQVEGAMEGLNTKIEVERKGLEDLDNYYRELTEREAAEEYNRQMENYDENTLIEVQTDNGIVMQKMPKPKYNEILMQVLDKHKDEYAEARRQIDWASTKAGVHNFWANSLINGMLNTTLKAGLMAPRVQESLRNSRLTGWAYKNPRFNVDADYNATVKKSFADGIIQVLKEPTGEGMEEYLQSLSNVTFSGAAENNINEFIKNKFEGDGTAKVTDTFGSDYAAALTALTGSLTDKESLESAILGAVSSTLGTVGGIGRGYHRDENGRLVQNSVFSPRNLGRSLTSEGQQESWGEYMRRVTPWRSGLVNAYNDRSRENEDAEEVAANLTEWLKDPQNRAKWDGLQGTAEWMTQMENASESNDQFSYRKSQMGKTINDIFMLKKLEGTSFYDSVLADLQRASSGEVTDSDIQKIRENGGDEYLGKTDEEIVEKIQSNANKMLGLLSTVEAESSSIDRLLGRIDEDTKQSLIFGKLMEQDFRERRNELKEEVGNIKRDIESSVESTSIESGLKPIIARYGSINKAIHAEQRLEEEKEKTDKKVKELEAIDPKKTTDKQKKDLTDARRQQKQINAELETLSVLKGEDGQIRSDLATIVLSERDIMDLDDNARATMLAQGATKLYNASHQNRQKVEQLNREIDEIERQIESVEAKRREWTDRNGRAKRHHNKQVAQTDARLKSLQGERDSKLRALDAEQGRMTTKSIYSEKQQEVIDNLIQQGTARDADFLNKVIDIARLDRGIKDYHTQYQAILSDPRAFQNYVQRAKYNAQRNLTRRRAERISRIQDFQEYSRELDKLTANASQQEINEVFSVLREQDRKQKAEMMSQQGIATIDETGLNSAKSNYEKYTENVKKQGDLIRQFAKNTDLTDNDQSLLIDAMQYLSSKGIDVTDREAAVEALIERDEEGNQGGKFRQWVEDKNAKVTPQQRAYMPVFTSIGQVVSQYVDLINSQQQDLINKGNIQPIVEPGPPVNTGSAATPVAQPAAEIIPTPSPSPAPVAQPQAVPQGRSIFDIAGGSTPEAGHFVDNDGTVATGAQTQSMQQREQEQGQEEKSGRRLIFERVTTPEIAKQIDESVHLIDNSNESSDVKDLALQYLEDLAVNNDETYSTLDDVLDVLQGQINKLRLRSDMEESNGNDWYKAAGLLNKVYDSLSTKKMRGRGRTAPMPSSKPVNPRASWIHTANIAYMEQQNPDAWAVRFTNDHAIDEWNRDHVIDRKEPVYFITDSEWTAEVTAQMNGSQEGRNYDALTDMPVVAAVKVDTPQNPSNTTAIEVNGQWYQPIGIMPSSKARSVQGAAMTEKIRKVASKEQGRHLVTSNGMPNGNPLITHVYGVNYLTMHHPDASGQTRRQNAEDNNTDVIDDVIDTLPRASQERLRAMSKQDMLNDSEYQEARGKFLNGLQWNGEGTGAYENQLTFTPENRREGETGNPMIVFTKPMSETTARNSDQTLPEVLANGTPDQVVTFNSRTERLYNEIIRPLFQYLPMADKHGDKSAKLITQADIDTNPNALQEEADRLTKMLNGYNGSADSKGLKGISDFIYINPRSGWHIQVTAPEALQTIGDNDTTETIYKIYFVNNDPDVAPIELGEIRVTKDSQNIDAAKLFLKSLMWDSQANQLRDFLNWQVPKADAQNLKNPDAGRSAQAKRNYAAIVDDGILTIAGTSIVYDVDGVKLNAPISSDGRIIYPTDSVSNVGNAQPATPQNTTPQGDGAVIAGNGQSVEPDSGASLEASSNGSLHSSTPRRNANLERAEAITRRIIENSKQFTLSEDETYYYITDNTTGEETKYLRVTTVIGADESVPQWTPTAKEIYDKLAERHTLPALDQQQLKTLNTIDMMSHVLNVSNVEIRRAVAELRTAHKKEKYGAWALPSASIGNTADSITRDFFAGKLKEGYPNITKEALDKFVQDLTIFKNSLESLGIHIVPEGVMAHGKITMTDTESNTHDVNVAGTLDLFGYDNNGNFYIFDMKTTRNHSEGKLQQEKAKWSRQISMYADLLKQTYGIDIDPNNLRIIPIDVDYPTPMGSRNDQLDPMGPQYSETDEGQLMMTYKEDNEAKPFDGSNLSMRGHTFAEQFPPGYTHLKINWDNLSSEDQDIATALATQPESQNAAEEAPVTAEIETPQDNGPEFMDTGNLPVEGTQDAVPQAAQVVQNGETSLLPQWNKLSNAVIGYLADQGILTKDDYNEILNSPADAEALYHELKCHNLM